MKICPRCQRTYPDDNLNFCLDDGAVLAQAGSGTPPETVLMNQPRMTDPAAAHSSQTGARPEWNIAPHHHTHPKKSSRTWLWVLGILAAVGVLCGGGLIGFFAYLASTVDSNKNVSNINRGPSNRNISIANKSTPSSSSDTKTTNRTSVETVDLSKWADEISIYGTNEIEGDELILSSRLKKYYYVVVTGDDYTTEGADTKVTLRNINDESSSLGYGLVFHSNPTPLTQGYAFLIDTKRKRYRLVRHQPQTETDVIKWTTSNSINDGTQPNVLEVKDTTDGIELYINGDLVNTVKNLYGYKNGVPGLYSGDAVKIAFKDLEIRK